MAQSSLGRGCVETYWKPEYVPRSAVKRIVDHTLPSDLLMH